MNLKLRRNRKILLLTVFMYITIIAVAGSQPIIAYSIG